MNQRHKKIFMQDKGKLLILANTITCGKELDIRQKIDRSKSFIAVPSQQSAGKRSKGGSARASENLRAAKALLVARKAKQKREKARARKCEGHVSKKDPGSNGNLVNLNHSSASRKRVSFC